MAFPDVELGITVEAFLGADPADDPDSWPSATDLSDRLLDQPIQTRRGRSPGQQSTAAGSCTFVLDNSDGELTWLLPTSTYYPNWDVGCPVRISVTNVGSDPPYPRFCGYISQIRALMIPQGPNSTVSAVEVTLAGTLDRIGQGSDPRSPMRRGIPRLSPLSDRTHLRGYWSAESGTLANLITPSLTGFAVGDATVEAVDEPPAGSAGAVRITPPNPITGSGRVRFPIAAHTAGGDIFAAVGFRQDLSELPGTATGGVEGNIRVRTSSTRGDLVFSWVTAPLTPSVSVAFTAGGSAAAGTADIADGAWHTIGILAQQSGGNINLFVFVDGVQIDGAVSGAGTVGLSTEVEMASSFWSDLGLTTFDAWPFEICHLTAWSEWSATLYPVDGIDGYTGEEAAARIARLGGEVGFPVEAPAMDSAELGPQPIGKTTELLADAEAADHGILSETRDTWGVTYIAADERPNRSTAALTIDLATYRVTEGGAQQVLTPLRNNARLRNQWTVTRPGGGGGTVVDAGHAAKHGLFDDEAQVNVASDSQAINVAGWLVHEGTFDGPRYSTMPLDLGANPTLLQSWLTADIGSRIDRANHPAIHPHGDVLMELLGYTETLRRKAWVAQLVVEPYGPWLVRETADDPIDTDTAGWLDWDTCTVAADVDDDDTSWSVTVDPVTTTDSDHYPLVVLVDGEDVTVTAVSGASSPQTWTVTRSTTAAKAHTSGAAIQSAEPLILTL